MNAPTTLSALHGAPTIIVAIVILLIYQGYNLSIVGVASPWIAKSFALDQAKLAELFAWMSLSAFGSLILARLADRVGRRRIILSSLVLAPLCAAGAAVARNAALFALFEIADFGAAWRLGFIRDRVTRGGTPDRAASAWTGLCGLRQCCRRSPCLHGDSLPAAVGKLVALAAGTMRCQESYWLSPIARMLPVDSRWARLALRQFYFQQPYLRHFSSTLSATRDHDPGLAPRSIRLPAPRSTAGSISMRFQ